MSAIASQPKRSFAARYWLELLWLAFGLANYFVRMEGHGWGWVTVHSAWLLLTVLYAFRVWPLRGTRALVGCVVALAAGSMLVDTLGGPHMWRQMFEVPPLMAAIFLAMVWTARRRVEALQVAEGRAAYGRSLLDRQERFMNDASHELRTPLTIARGHLELLQARRPMEKELDVALEELGRVEALIERLLVLADLGQPDSLHIALVDIEPFVEDVFFRWSELAPRSWRLGPLTAGALRVDPDRLRTVLDALLENAVKYTHEFDLIELRAQSEGDGHLVIEVEDEGPGISEEALSRIFDRFGRADAARSRAGGGVGLGLAIADAIAKAHGGQCTVQTSVHGSTFALRLPAFTPAAVPMIAPSAPAAPAHSV